MVVRISDKTQNYSKVTKLLVKPRRNAIAHQNDRSHDSGIQDDIEKLYVVDNIETVKKIAYEIFSIANAK